MAEKVEMTRPLVAVLAFLKDSAMEWIWQIGLKPGAIDAEIHWALAQMESLLERSG